MQSKDCLNLFRLLAAIGVMYGHAVRHLSVDLPDSISFILGWLPGVPLFFCLSGFLIWPSIGRSNSFGEYCRKRFWRIYPELWVAVLVCSVTILLFYDSSIEWGKFLVFNITQATFLQFWTPDFLRGYGCGTPNGALWTITVIVQFYLIGFLLYKFVYKKNRVWIAVLLLSMAVALLHGNIVKMIPQTLGKLYSVTVVPYCWMFLLGAFLSEKKDECISILKKYWWTFLVGAFFVRFFKLDLTVVLYGLFYSILSFLGFIGFAYKFPVFNLKKDISYAVYVYHMVVVNAFIAIGFTHKVWNLLAVVVLTFVIGYVSTVTVGAMGLKKKQQIIMKNEDRS